MFMGLDFIIVLLYLLLIIYLGFVSSSRVKTLSDYSVAKVNYSTFAIVATMSATLIGGGTMGIADKVYKYGFVYVFVVSGAAINQILIGQYIAPKIKSYKNIISIGDLMKSIYGRDVQFVTGVFAVIISMGFVIVQITAIGELIRHFLSFGKLVSLIIGYTLIVCYSVFGGMRSVVSTDIIQFIILAITIPIICSVGINQLGGFESFYSNVPEFAFQLDFFANNRISEFLIFLMVGAFIPSFLQRILIAQNSKQAVLSTTINGIISVPFYLILGFVGLIALQLVPNIESQSSVMYLADNVMPYGIKGLAVAGILSILMSSADSELNVAGVTFVNDILKNIIKVRVSNKIEILIARLATVFVGIFAIAVNSHVTDIMIYSFSFWAPTILIPMIFGLYGLTVDRVILYGGMAVSFIFVFAIDEQVMRLFGVSPIIVSIVVNALIYLLYFSWVNSKNLKVICFNKALLLIKTFYQWQIIVERRVNIWGDLFKKKILKAEVRQSYCKIFGVFSFLFYLIPYFLWSYSDKNYSIIILFRIIACVMSITLLIDELWKGARRKWLPIYWVVTLTYTLPFLSSYMLFHNHFTLPWMINSIIAMFVLALLVDWFSFVVILIIGIFSSVIFFDITGDFEVELYNIYNLIVGILMYLFALIVGAIFLFKRDQDENVILSNNRELEKLNKILKSKSNNLTNALNAKQEFLNNMSHEIRTPVHGIYNISNEINNNWGSLSDKRKQECIRILASSGERLANLVNNVLDLSKITSGTMQYNFYVGSLNEILQQAIDYARTYSELNSLEFDLQYKASKDIKIVCDAIHLKIAVQNILTNAIKYGGGKVEVKISSHIDAVRIVIKDNGIGIPKNELKKIFEPFVESSLTKNKAGGKGIGLALCKEIIHAHSGEVAVKKSGKAKGSSFEIILPKKKG